MSISLIRRTLSPIGARKDGSPIYSYFGAEGDDGGGDEGGTGSENDDGGGSEDEDDDRTVGDDGLTGKGRKAIQAERAAARRAQNALKPFSQLRKETGLTFEEMKEKLLGSTSTGSGSTRTKEKGGEEPVDVEAVRREARREVQQKSDTRYIKMAVKAEAASVLNDPEDANRFLDLSSYTVDDEGNVDIREIKRDLTALIEDKPYLAKKQKSTDFEGGSRGSGAGKGSMSDTIRRAAGIIR